MHSKAEREKQIESFFEPWEEDRRGDVVDRLDGFVAEFLSERSKRRAIACTNALAGIPNPEAVRELVRVCREAFDPKTVANEADALREVKRKLEVIGAAVEALSAPPASPQQK